MLEPLACCETNSLSRINITRAKSRFLVEPVKASAPAINKCTNFSPFESSPTSCVFSVVVVVVVVVVSISSSSSSVVVVVVVVVMDGLSWSKTVVLSSMIVSMRW